MGTNPLGEDSLGGPPTSDSSRAAQTMIRTAATKTDKPAIHRRHLPGPPAERLTDSRGLPAAAPGFSRPAHRIREASAAASGMRSGSLTAVDEDRPAIASQMPIRSTTSRRLASARSTAVGTREASTSITGRPRSSLAIPSRSIPSNTRPWPCAKATASTTGSSALAAQGIPPAPSPTRGSSRNGGRSGRIA